MYNTETAKLVDTAAWGTDSDFSYWIEELYKKRTGEYFIAGEGGPTSRWRESVGRNGFCSGRGIKPLTDEEARDWLEKYGDPDSYIAEFGEPEE